MAVERKYERDIDLLLAEEVVVSPDFADWLLRQTSFAGLRATVVDVFVSRTDATGESDLVVVYEEHGAVRRFALLIENKIDAPFQPDQGARYRLRAQREMAQGDYQAFEVLLCAPEAYGTTRPGAAAFDRIVSYESIAAFLKNADPGPRGQYRANFVATAALRNANTWTRVSDDATDAFWSAAYRMAAEEFPILEMTPKELTRDSSWITARPRDLPTKPIWTYVSLKGDRGSVDLTFTGSRYAAFAEAVAPLLEPGMTVQATGKSAAIRLSVDGFAPRGPLDRELPKVRRAFEACARLITFYRAHRGHLDQVARATWSP